MEWIGGAVALRAIEEDDLDVIAAYLSDPSMAGLRGVDGDRNGPMSRSDLRKRIEDWARPQHGLVLALDRGEVVVGHVLIDLWWDALCPHLDIVVAPDHRRRGHGADGVRDGAYHDDIFFGQLRIEWEERHRADSR